MPCGCQPKPPDYEHTNLHENWKLNYKSNNSVTISNKNNNRTSRKRYPNKGFKIILERDINDILSNKKIYCNMIFHKKENYITWLPCCLLENEVLKDYNIILLGEEMKSLCHPDHNVRCIKVCLFNTKDKFYRLRTIFNVKDKINNDYKELENSQNSNWFIDESKMAADVSFWENLYNLIYIT